MLYALLEWLRSWLAERGRDWGLEGGVLGLMDQVPFRAMAAALLAFLLVAALGKPVIRWLKRQKIGDAGMSDAAALADHAAGKKNVPTMGGVLIGGAVFVAAALLADVRVFEVQLGLMVLVWLGVVGGFDDWLKLTSQRRGTGRQGLKAWEKLVFQLGIGLLVGVFLYRHGIEPPPDGMDADAVRPMAHVLNLPFQRTYLPGGGGIGPGLIYLSFGAFVAVSVLLVAGLSNAVNITDGMDGLAGSIAGIVSLAVMALALVAGSEGVAQYLLVPHVPSADELGVLAGALAGACLGFLWWNWSPADVFMGDTGSLLIGGVLAYIALVIRQEAVLLLMLGVCLAEMFSVMVQVSVFKISRGTFGFFTVGNTRRVLRCAPLHHHLQLGGWKESKVVGRLILITVLLTLAALATLKMR